MTDFQSIVTQMQHWLLSQVENGYTPNGDSVEMTHEYAAGRNAAFSAAQQHLIALVEAQSPTFQKHFR